MNRLACTRAYLAGPIDRAPDGGVGWRQRLKEELADLQILWLDPTCKPTSAAPETPEIRAQWEALRQVGDYQTLGRQLRQIRCVDLRLVDVADYLIVHLDQTISICGTMEEIAWANRQKKPILVHMEQGKNAIPMWLFGMLPEQMMFSTWDDLTHYVRHIAHDQDIDPVKRWYFFNFTGTP
jgi:nucleoside 2-deoxyribosyltransferase